MSSTKENRPIFLISSQFPHNYAVFYGISSMLIVDDDLHLRKLVLSYAQAEPGAYDLCEIVEHEVRHCEQIAQENHLSLSFDGPSEELTVQVDAHGMAYGVDCQDGLTCFWCRYPANPS